MSRKIKTFLEMIKFEHSVFALPFAFMGAVLGAIHVDGRLPSWAEIGWVTLAMIGARSAAMGLNRVIDKAIDKKNPRTAGRAIPAGLITSGEALVFIALSFALLFYAASQLNLLSVQLLPVAVVFLVVYSYTKRFTWLCHIVLGMTLGLAPLGGWVAVTGDVSVAAFVFFAIVLCWSAGFDIIYACQDVDFDRQEGLYSIPSRFGIRRALIVAKGLHLLAAAGFLSLIWLTELSGWYICGMLIAYLILVYEHRLVTPKDLSKLNTAFFTMNGVLSCVVFAFTLIDVLVRHSW